MLIWTVKSSPGKEGEDSWQQYHKVVLQIENRGGVDPNIRRQLTTPTLQADDIVEYEEGVEGPYREYQRGNMDYRLKKSHTLGPTYLASIWHFQKAGNWVKEGFFFQMQY